MSVYSNWSNHNSNCSQSPNRPILGHEKIPIESRTYNQIKDFIFGSRIQSVLIRKGHYSGLTGIITGVSEAWTKATPHKPSTRTLSIKVFIPPNIEQNYQPLSLWYKTVS